MQLVETQLVNSELFHDVPVLEVVENRVTVCERQSRQRIETTSFLSLFFPSTHPAPSLLLLHVSSRTFYRSSTFPRYSTILSLLFSSLLSISHQHTFNRSVSCPLLLKEIFPNDLILS